MSKAATTAAHTWYPGQLLRVKKGFSVYTSANKYWFHLQEGETIMLIRVAAVAASLSTQYSYQRFTYVLTSNGTVGRAEWHSAPFIYEAECLVEAVE